MMRMVMQAETPAVRTCATARARGTDITPDDFKGDCRSDMCLTCSSRDPNSGFNKDEYDIHYSGMMQYWRDMNTHPSFEDWDTPEKIDKLCAYIAAQHSRRRTSES
eukprot:15751036-Heterocapsa_arctica.AAC.1